MAKCRKCGKSGLFLKLNDANVCQSCVFSGRKTLQTYQNLLSGEIGAVYDALYPYNEEYIELATEKIELLCHDIEELSSFGITAHGQDIKKILSKIKTEIENAKDVHQTLQGADALIATIESQDEWGDAFAGDDNPRNPEIWFWPQARRLRSPHSSALREIFNVSSYPNFHEIKGREYPMSLR